MSKKKSYMDISNILSEGKLMDFIAKLLLGGKVRQLQRKFRSDRKITAALDRIDKNYDFLEKRFKEKGIDINNPKF